MRVQSGPAGLMTEKVCTMNISKTGLVLFFSLIASACTWVELKQEANAVRIASAEDVVKCKKMGSTTVSVKADVATFARDAEKIQQELETLARNSAPHMGGNVVVPVSEINKGEQSFVIYACPDSNASDLDY